MDEPGRSPFHGSGVSHAQALELAHDPAVGGAERRIATVNGEEEDRALRLGEALGRGLDELAGLEVALDEVLGKVAPPEVATHERVFGVEVGNAPGARRQDAAIGDALLVSLGEDDLDSLCETR